jgi:Pentapeptide repeats (8 copies)
MVEPMAASELPKITKDPMYQLLRVDNVKAFNLQKESGATCDLVCVNLRGLDMRGLDAEGLDFTDSYMRGADLRGIDFRKATLEGVNIRGANISGTYFPCELSPEEIRMSHEMGTRMRYRPAGKSISIDD